MKTFIVTAHTTVRDIRVVVSAATRREARRLAEPVILAEATHRITRRTLQELA